MYKEDDYRMISEIQHFSFCRRQWALIHIEQQWSDNYLTTAGTLMHDRVHTHGLKDSREGVITVRGMRVKSAVLGISGECDAIEFYPSDDGIHLHGKDGLWDPCPVEYKHGRQKTEDFDRLQLAAQALCIEEMFSHPVKQGFIYYQATRHRETVFITSELKKQLENMISEMHKYAKDGYTPKVKGSDKCKSCSLYDVCIPKLADKTENPINYVKRHLEEL